MMPAVLIDVALFAAYVASSSRGLVLMKRALVQLREAAAPPAERVFFGVLGWKSAAGLALFGCAGILYAVLLSSISLNLAQVFAGAQFAGVVLAASLASTINRLPDITQ